MLDSPFSCDCGSSPLRLARPGLHSGKRNRGGAFFWRVNKSASRPGGWDSQVSEAGPRTPAAIWILMDMLSGGVYGYLWTFLWMCGQRSVVRGRKDVSAVAGPCRRPRKRILTPATKTCRYHPRKQRPLPGDPGSWGTRRVLRPPESRFSGVKIGTHGRPVVRRSPASAGPFDHRFSDADFPGTHPAMTRMDWSRIADSPRVDASQFTGSLLSTTAKCGTLADELAHEAFNPGFPPRLDALRDRSEGQGSSSTLPESAVPSLVYCTRDKRRVLISHGFMWNRMVVPSPTGPTLTSSSKVVSVARTWRGS